MYKLSVSHEISGTDIEHLTDRLYFTDDIIVFTDRTSIDMNSGEVKTIKVEENDARKSFGYRVNDNGKFLLACEINQNVCFSDHINYCIYKIDFLDKVTSLYLAQEGKAGKNEGPKRKARLYYPVILASEGHSLLCGRASSRVPGRYSHGLFTSWIHTIPVRMA